MEQDTVSEKYASAKKRVYEIKKFYKHVIFYLMINFFFIGRRIYKDITNGESLIDAFTDIENYDFFFWWAIILIIHAVKVFGFPNVFNKNWEALKIKEFMKTEDEEKRKKL